MANGTKLGDLYFDVLLSDNTSKQISDIKQKLENIKIGVGNASDVRATIKKALGEKPFKVGIVVDKAEASRIVQQALDKASVKLSMTAGEKRAYEAQTKADNLRLLTETKIAAIREKINTQEARTAAAWAQQALSAQRAANAMQRGGGSFGGTTIGQTNTALGSQIALLQQAKTYALQYINVFAAANFVKDLARVTGEFEKQLITLKAILQSSSQAQTLFNQIKQLSVVSPFTFMDLTSFAKQLSAYQIPANELYDTTKRLSDLSAGLGVDMSRIVLAYGQVRSAAFLRGQELRQFTEAGIPMVNALADKFSDLEGRVVSTGEVFEKISKREVPFEMVKEVIEDLTNSGGKFYNMQEKQSESLAGKIANLADAYDIMRYNIGSSNGLLKSSVEMLTTLMNRWKDVRNAIVAVGAAWGAMKAYGWLMGRGSGTTGWTQSVRDARRGNIMEASALSSKGKLSASEQNRLAMLKEANSQRQLTSAQAQAIVVQNNLTMAKITAAALTGQLTAAETAQLKATVGHMSAVTKLERGYIGLKGAMKDLVSSMVALAADPMMWIFAVIGGLVDLAQTILTANKELAEFNTNLQTGAAESAKDASKALQDLNGQFQTLLSGNLDNGEEKMLLEKYVEQIRNIIPDSDALVASLTNSNGFATMADRVKAAQKALEDYDVAMNKISATAQKLDLGHDYSFLGSNLRERTDEYVQTINNFVKNGKLSRLTDDNSFVSSFKKGINALSESIEGMFAKMGNMTERQRSMAIDYYEQQIKAAQMMQGASQQTIDAIMAHLDMKLRSGEDRFKAFNDILIRELKGDKAARELFKEFDGRNMPEQGKAIVKRLQEGMMERFPDMRNDIQAWMNANPLTWYGQIRMTFSNDKPLSSVMQTAYNNLKAKGGLLTMSEQQFKKRFNGLIREDANYSTAAKELTDLYNDNAKEIKAAIKAKGKVDKSVQELQKKQDNIKTLASLLNMTIEEPSSGKNSGGKNSGGKGKQEDEYIKALKEQKARYDEANSLISSLAKVMDESKAITEVLGMKGNGGLDRAKLGKGNQKTLLSYFLTAASKHNTEDARKYVAELRKTLNKEIVDKQVEAFNDAIAAIKRKLDLTLSNFKLFDTLFAKTGDVSFATLFSFGRNGKVFEDAIQAQISALNKVLAQEGGGLDYSQLVKMSAEELQRALSGNEISDTAVKMFDNIQKAISDKQTALATKMADSIAKTMTAAEQIAMKRQSASREIQDMLDLAVNRNVLSRKEADVISIDSMDANAMQRWVDAFKGLDGKEQVIRAIIGVTKQLEEETGKLSDEVFELSGIYDHLFNSAGEQSIRTISHLSKLVKKIIGSAKQSGKSNFEITVPEQGADGKETNKTYTITRKQFEKLRKLNRDYDTKIGKANPFKAVRDAYVKYKKATTQAEKDEALDEMLQGIQDISSAASAGAKVIGDLFGAFGDENTKKSLEQVSNIITGIGSAIGGWASGRYDKMASGIISVVTTIADMISGDDILNENIAASQRSANFFQAIYDDISRNIARSLGGASTLRNAISRRYQDLIDADDAGMKALISYWESNGSAFDKMLAEVYKKEYSGIFDLAQGGNPYELQLKALMAQREKVGEMLADEKKKKHKDQDAIDEDTAKMAELDDQIRHFADDTLKELLGIDLKGWADQISDSLVDAFANGESAAKAFDSTVRDIMNSVVSKMISLNIIQPAMDKLRNYLFGSDGKSGVFGNGSDYEMTAEDVAGMAPYINELKGKIGAANDLWNKINEAFGGVLSNANGASGTLSSGIKSVTEDTADLLASYINAIRADVSLMRMLQEALYGNGGIAQLQLWALNQIQVNTRTSADNTQAIISLLQGVIVAGSSGNRVRV